MRALLREKACCLLLLAAAVSSCGQRPQQAPAPPPAVTVAHPLEREITEWDKYTGRLAAVETVEVRARVSGYLEEIHFKEGQVVEKGARLFTIDPRPYEAVSRQAQAREAQVKARLELAQTRLRRAEGLLEKNAIATDDYDVIVGEEKEAAAELQAAKAAVAAAALDLGFTDVRAPIAGRTSRFFVTEGNLINGGTAQSTLLTTIVSLDPIHCYFEANEQALLKYIRLSKSGDRPSSRDVANPVYVALADESGFPHHGRMDFVDNRVDPDTGTIRGRAVLPNPDEVMQPGMFVKLRLPGRGRYLATLVPDEAIGSDQAERFILVVDGDNRVARRNIELGPRSGGLRVVREGVRKEDRVIVRGVQMARPGMAVSPEAMVLVYVPDLNEPSAGQSAESGEEAK